MGSSGGGCVNGQDLAERPRGDYINCHEIVHAVMLQELGEFDTKTSSWLCTSAEIRKLGGAIFGDRRFDRVFIYHNGAESYFGTRGFRGSLRV